MTVIAAAGHRHGHASVKASAIRRAVAKGDDRAELRHASFKPTDPANLMWACDLAI
jgi:hypothetical protein